MQPIDQQLQALNMDIACGVMNTVVIGDLQKVIENHNSNWRVFCHMPESILHLF